MANFDGLAPTFATPLQRFIADNPFGARLNSAYRSPERQAQLYAAALEKYGSPEAARKWVAPPGRSHHNAGMAADLGWSSSDAQKWAHDNAANYGLAFPLPNENWHVEPIGARDQSGSQGNAASAAINASAPQEGGDMARAIQNSIPGTGGRIDGGMTMAQPLDPRTFDEQRRTLAGVNASTPGLALAKALTMGLNGYGERQNNEAISTRQQALAQALLGVSGGIPGADPEKTAMIAALDPEFARSIATAGIEAKMKPVDPLDGQIKQATLDNLRMKATPQTYSPLSAEDRAKFNIKPDDPRPWVMSPEGEPKIAGGSGVTVNNNNAGENEFDKKAAGQKADYYGKLAERGAGAAAASQELGLIDELAKMAPQGPIVGRLTEMFPGVSSAGDAFISAVNRIAPALRVPGSGAQSDRDVDILMAGLPRLRNQPEANAVITQAFRMKVQIDQERAAVANAALNGKISREEADQKIQELESKSILPENMRQMLSVGGGTPATPGAPDATSLKKKWGLE